MFQVYKHYTFFSLRLMCENSKRERVKNEDVDFNIILFKDFIITVHDKEWSSIPDILGFLNLLCTVSQSVMTPDWVLFSCFIEMSQDAKYLMDLIEPEIDNIRVESKSIEMSDIMRRNFDMELKVYTISRFIKPKMKILRQFKVKCAKRLNKIVMRLLCDILEDFRELSYDLYQFNHILERSQDTFLAIVTSDQSREANEMSRVMKRISEIALVFLPVQAIGGFFGMNVQVPYQMDIYPTEMYFWIIVGICLLTGLALYTLRNKILRSGLWTGFYDCLQTLEWIKIKFHLCKYSTYTYVSYSFISINTQFLLIKYQFAFEEDAFSCVRADKLIPKSA